MDTLTHTLTGWTIARCLPQQRWGKWVAPTAIVAANLPDFEFFFVPPSDKAAYLLNHRGWSHGLLGITLEVVAWTAIVVLVLFCRRRRILWSRATGLRVLLVVAGGAYSHLLLDWFNSYGVRPLYPIDKAWYYGDLVFLMDPWIWLTLAGTLFLGSRFACEADRSKLGHRLFMLVWIVGWVYPTTIIVLATLRHVAPPAVIIIWLAVVAVLFTVRAFLKTSQHPRRLSVAAVLLVAGYISWLAHLSHVAKAIAVSEFRDHAAASRNDGAELGLTEELRASVNPSPGIPWQSKVLIQNRSSVYGYDVNALDSKIVDRQVRATNLDDPGLARIRNTAQFKAWASFARHPIVRREGETLFLGDARYALQAYRKDWSEQSITP